MSRFNLLLSANLLGALSSASLAHAASPDAVLDSKLRAVSTILDAKLTKESVPGAAFAIVSDQEKIWSHQFGVEDLSDGQAVNDDTAFSICSISKLFTGIAIMDLEEAGKIELDAPLSTYLGEDAGDGGDVTVRNLLSHVSGFPREGDTDFWFRNDFPDQDTLLADVSARADWYDPYDHWQYSNLGMAALGQVIHSVSGKSFHDYVNANVLDPLGMDNTTTDMPFEKVGNGFARGYYVRDAKGQRTPVEPHQFKAFAPAAGVASSVNDLVDFMSWQFRLRDSDDAEILEPATLKTMQRVHWTGEDFDEPAWGLAFATRRYSGKTLWGHGGYCPGTVASFVMRNSDKFGVIVLATANDVSSGGLSEMIYSLVAADVKAVKSASEKTEADEAESDETVSLAEYEGHYSRPNYDWDVYIGLTKDGLFSVPLHSPNPHSSVSNYKQVEGDAFKQKRDDGSLGVPLQFVRNDDGQITEVVRNGYRLLRN